MDWVERVTRVRRWARGQERAPHKPLLLLYALGHFQRHGDAPIVYSAAKEQLGRLLREFGPPRPTTPAYPFHHLSKDGLWEVRTADGGASPGPRVGLLRDTAASGRLTNALIQDLRHQPRLLSQLGRALLDANFEPSLHEDICAEIGLDLETAEVGPEAARRRRGRDFRAQVMVAYEYQCAFCGYDGWLSGTAVGLDAAHVQWWAFDGPDDVTNGICLCALHHKLFDKGVLGMTADRQVAVSVHYIGRGRTANDQVLVLAGREVGRPQPAFPGIDAHHITWHTREVFRSLPEPPDPPSPRRNTPTSTRSGRPANREARHLACRSETANSPTSRQCLTCTHAGWWAGRSLSTCAPNWSSPRRTRPAR